jgi:thymidylate kinase
MERAHEVTMTVLRELEPVISSSPAGPGWSSDIDVHVTDAARAASLGVGAGWIALSAIDRHLGYPDSHAFAIVADGEILARADIQTSPAPDPLTKVLKRADRLGGPDARTVVELRSLPLDQLDGSRSQVIEQAAALEHAMGGSLLAGRLGDVSATPRVTGAGRPRRGPRPQARIGISGVDGAGKSTLITGLQEALDICGLPSQVIWTRPGMGLNRLDALATRIRRLRGEDEPGIRQLAEGGDPGTITSRRGVVGWLWLTLVTIAFISVVRRETRKAHGVVIYDRHLLDAMGTIEVFYRGVDSRLQRRLVRAAMPEVDLAVWLVIEPHVAASRKPGDMIGQDLVAAQHESYLRHSSQVRGLLTIDATKPPHDVLHEVLIAFENALSSRRRRFVTVAMTSLRRLQSLIRDS